MRTPSQPRPRRAIFLLSLLATIAACGGGDGTRQASWVGTWSNAPMCASAARLIGLPPTEFDDQSIRMTVRTSIGGDAVRVKLTNQCGDDPLEIGAATVAVRDSAASVVSGTVRTLTFNDATSVTIPARSVVTSDPIDLALPAESDLSITLYLPGHTVPSTAHPVSATGYISTAGDFTQAIDGAAFPTTTTAWYFLDAVDVLSSTASGAIVAFGDSVTEGTGTTFSGNNRWPDVLARRLFAETKELGVLNQGINGNKVLSSLLGDSALKRFDKDVLGQSGVKYVILLEGINDIGLASDVTAVQVIAGYLELVERAHAAGLPIFVGTLTPAKDNPYSFYAPYEESKRAAVNQFIRESGAFDAVIDFDAAVSDPGDPVHWRPGFSPDALHPSDAGAEALANAVDLSLFR